MDEHVLKPPDDFPFPFQPYPIQDDFMHALYSTIEEGKLGIFESPTGTGKSLSILCGALCWLRDHLVRERTVLTSRITQLKEEEEKLDAEGDWLSGQARKLEVERERRQLEQTLASKEKQDADVEQMKKRVKNKETKLKESHDFTKKKQDIENDQDALDDEDLLLEEMDRTLTEEFDSDVESDCEKEDKPTDVQIIICSRTHSQLSQLVGEVIRSPFSEVRLVPLASRQNYCINSAVRKLHSLSLINERCSDLQKGSKGRKTKAEDGATVKRSKGSSGCPHVKSAQLVTQLSEMALTQVQDVETLVDKGKTLSACPYYASRAAVPNAQVLVVPYNTLLHKGTRETVGLRLENSVVIIDEAHNLLDSISQVYSAHVTGQQLTHAHSQLVQYRDKYSKRFSPTNLLHLEQLIFVVGKLIAMLGGVPGGLLNETLSQASKTKLFSLSEFLLEAKIDNINQFHLIEFAHRSKLSHKLHGFSERHQPSVKISQKAPMESGVRAFLKEITSKTNTPNPAPVMPTVEEAEVVSNNPILPVIAFLQALTSASEDGRVVCSVNSSVSKGSLKYLLLNPASHFSDIIRQARSVVVAGGTMQPVSEFRDQLFISAGASVDRISYFSCGHVIPPDHILPIVLCSGVTGQRLDFSFRNRTSSTQMTELGRTLENMCNIVPGGIICFFSSYDYEQTVYQHFHKTGVIDKLSTKKKIFREPRKSSQVDQVLSEYAAVINSGKKNPALKPNGAILFSVVGGKLSEGLNFSDDLGRCVAVVGMPYPNSQSPELQEKMAYLDKTMGKGEGRRHYDNLCMKAVNQCIGRAVRHSADYATVLLLDSRYEASSTQSLLPKWIQTSLQVHQRAGPAIGTIARFFAAKRNKSTTN